MLDLLNIGEAGVDFLMPPPDVQEWLRQNAEPGSVVAQQGDRAFDTPEGQLAAWKFVSADWVDVEPAEAALMKTRCAANPPAALGTAT